MRFDQFVEQNGPGSTEENVIEDPNITRQKSTLAENAAKAGFKAIPKLSNEQRKVDYVQDLGMKSPEEIAAENQTDLEKTLGPDMMALAERKRREITEFNDALEQCGGKMTQEDFEMITETPDYEAMLYNPPDPLNKDLKKYKEEQIKKALETATPEELAAMGLAPEDDHKNNKQVTLRDRIQTRDNVVPIQNETNEKTEEEEDREIMSDMEDIVIPELPNDMQGAINTEPANHEDNDVIPVVTETYTEDKTEHVVKQAEIKEHDTEETHFDDDPNKDIVQKATSESNLSDINNIDIDKELAELDKDSEAEDTESQKIYKEKLKSAGRDVKNKVIPLAARINIAGFELSNKPVSISNSVNMAKAVHQGRSARWALFSSKMPIVMTEFSGPDIDELVKVTQGNTFTTTDLMKRYSLFYDHIISPKPIDVEQWLKVVSVMDIKHLYGAAYKASFDGINFLPYDCTNERCNNGFITDSMPFDDLILYEDDDAKKNAMEIYRSEPSTDSYGLYHTEVVPISDVYAFSFKEPSIWDAQLAPLYLDREWYNKMEGTIAINTYVDKIFVIDQTSRTIRPLDVKEYRNDAKKTLKAKVLALAKVISTLTSDQYNLISAYIEEINKPSSYVDYQLPEVICPKCKTKIEARPTTASNLLFTRHRLTSLANG